MELEFNPTKQILQNEFDWQDIWVDVYEVSNQRSPGQKFFITLKAAQQLLPKNDWTLQSNYNNGLIEFAGWKDRCFREKLPEGNKDEEL